MNVALLNVRLGNTTFGLGSDFANFLADDALDNALHLSAAVVTTTASRAGSWGGSRSVAGGRGTSIGGVAAAAARAGSVIAGAVFRVVDNVGAGISVRSRRIVDVGVEDSWVGIGVATGESDGVGSRWESDIGDGRSRRAQIDLNTGRVEFGTTELLTVMQSEEFVTDEVSTGRQIGRESDVKERVDIIVVQRQSPIAIVQSTLFVNLEKLGLGRVEFGTADVTAGSHVGHDGADVVYPWSTFTVVPSKAEGRAGTGVGDESGVLSVLAAAEEGVVGTFDGIDRVDLANSVLLAVFGVGSWAHIFGAIDEDTAHPTMSIDEGSESSESDKSVSEHDS